MNSKNRTYNLVIMRLRVLNRLIVGLFIFVIPGSDLSSQNTAVEIREMKNTIEAQNQKIQTLESRLNATDSDIRQELSGSAPVFMVLFLFGTVCALWAQGSGRNAIAWFFLGLIFSIIAAITVLYINGKELNENH